MLWGEDASAVEPAPEFPKTISVEDSYANVYVQPEGVQAEFERLSASLLKRLECVGRRADGTDVNRAELVDEPATLGAASSTSRRWAMYPTQLRLSLAKRGTWGRESRSAPLPVDILDLALPFDQRTTRLVKTFTGLARAILGSAKFELVIINLAVADLSATPPSRSIAAAFAKPQPPRPREDDGEIDETFLAALPPDMRAEVEAQLGRPAAKKARTAAPVVVESDDDGEDERSPKLDDDAVQCEQCRIWLVPWAIDSHRAALHRSM